MYMKTEWPSTFHESYRLFHNCRKCVILYCGYSWIGVLGKMFIIKLWRSGISLCLSVVYQARSEEYPIACHLRWENDSEKVWHNFLGRSLGDSYLQRSGIKPWNNLKTKSIGYSKINHCDKADIFSCEYLVDSSSKTIKLILCIRLELEV